MHFSVLKLCVILISDRLGLPAHGGFRSSIDRWPTFISVSFDYSLWLSVLCCLLCLCPKWYHQPSQSSCAIWDWVAMTISSLQMYSTLFFIQLFNLHTDLWHGLSCKQELECSSVSLSKVLLCIVSSSRLPVFYCHHQIWEVLCLCVCSRGVLWIELELVTFLPRHFLGVDILSPVWFITCICILLYMDIFNTLFNTFSNFFVNIMFKSMLWWKIHFKHIWNTMAEYNISTLVEVLLIIQ